MNLVKVLKYCCLKLSMVVLILQPSITMADLGVEDPTRPVYMSKQIKNAEISDIDLEAEKKASIPVLTQLIYSSSRKIAVFGDTILKVGETADFGKVIEIKKDRVLVQTDNEVKEIVFYEQFEDELKTDESEADQPGTTTLSQTPKIIQQQSADTVYIR